MVTPFQNDHFVGGCVDQRGAEPVATVTNCHLSATLPFAVLQHCERAGLQLLVAIFGGKTEIRTFVVVAQIQEVHLRLSRIAVVFHDGALQTTSSLPPSEQDITLLRFGVLVERDDEGVRNLGVSAHNRLLRAHLCHLRAVEYEGLFIHLFVLLHGTGVERVAAQHPLAGVGCNLEVLWEIPWERIIHLSCRNTHTGGHHGQAHKNLFHCFLIVNLNHFACKYTHNF